jgi:dihydrofolate reductase
MDITLIAAVARNGVIGNQGKLVFALPGDLPRFKALTMGKPVIMGRKTWESLPKKPLPGRRNIVLTHRADFEAAGAEIIHTPVQALALLADEPEAVVIGGAEVYALFLPLANRLELTEVEADAQGDTVFPPFNHDEWQETARVAGPEHIPAFSYVTYIRR